MLPILSYSQSVVKLDTSNLINGNGIAFFISSKGKNLGFATYKNNSWNGKFYLIDTAENYALAGDLTNDSTCLEYIPGFKVKYRTAEKPDTLTITIDTSLFRQIFEYTTSTVFSKEPTNVLKKLYSVHPELHLSLNYITIPVGRWQKIDLKKKYVFTDFYFDECGNGILARYYNPDGSILIEHNLFPPDKRKRMW